MATKVKDRPADPKSTVAVVVFGLDENGKPKAARFPESQRDLATKAAGQLKLNALASDKPAVVELAARLPAGRLYSNGRGFVPYVRRDLYDKVAAAAGTPEPAHQPTEPADGVAKPTNRPNRKPASEFPRNWDDVGPGHHVLVHDSPDEGWYDAEVVERTGDILVVRWPNYPRERRTPIHRFKVGLLYPHVNGVPPGPEPTDKAGKRTTTRKQDQATNTGAGAAQALLPKDWADIDANHLVLARDDGPWKSWWEAVATDRNGDQLTLTWRDHSKLPPIVRSRFSLALICPNPK